MADETPSPFASTSSSIGTRTVKARNFTQKNFAQIGLDAKRTGGAAVSSTAPRDRIATYRPQIRAILEAWTVLNPGVVYTQGLNEVAAVLLLRHSGDVSKAMADLQRLAAPNTLGGLWSKGMPLYEEGRKQLRLLLASRLPLLQQRLDSVGLDDSAYLPQAWHSLFAKWLPLEFATVAIDDLLDHAMATVLAITIAVLTELQDHILQALEPEDAGIEVLLGPDGFFSKSKLREFLKGRGASLQAQWQSLQRNEEITHAGFTCLEYAIGGDEPLHGLSRSMCDMVHQEAVLQLATTASSQDNDQLIAVFHKCKSAQDKATQDAQLMGDHRYLFTCVVMGESDVGKSQLVNCETHSRDYSFNQHWSMGADGQLQHEILPTFESPTVGLDVSSRIVKISNRQRERVKLQIWDLSGNRSSLSVTRPYLRDMAAAILVYDICCHESFVAVQEVWLKEFRQNAGSSDYVLLLVGNKLDQEDSRQVPVNEAKEFAARHNMFFCECSALSGQNVRFLFDQIAEQINSLVLRTPCLPLGVRNMRYYGSFTESVLDRSDSSFYGRLDGCRRVVSHGGRCHIS